MAPIVIVTRDSTNRVYVEWFEDETGYCNGDPIASAGYDVVHIRRNCPPETATQVFRLYQVGWSGFDAAADAAATHRVPEPGAPLEPIPGRGAA